eukprot:GHVU01231312.1.p1 GENE.GHVU01231312.1~~GHVU01231312.1.p1  ORF type:complete len:151 (-),score=16.12 GHVU01231312.1:200-652(-)
MSSRRQSKKKVAVVDQKLAKEDDKAILWIVAQCEDHEIYLSDLKGKFKSLYGRNIEPESRGYESWMPYVMSISGLSIVDNQLVRCDKTVAKRIIEIKKHERMSDKKSKGGANSDSSGGASPTTPPNLEVEHLSAEEYVKWSGTPIMEVLF